MRVNDNKLMLWFHLNKTLYYNGWLPIVTGYHGSYYKRKSEFWTYLGNYTGVKIHNERKDIYVSVCKWNKGDWRLKVKMNFKDPYLEEKLMEYVEDERVYGVEWVTA